MKSRVSLVLAMAALAVLVFPALGSANLLVEGGFEINNLAPLGSIVGPPFTPAMWGYEVASNVNLGNAGILPLAGKWMHQMNIDGGYTQTLQFVDITLYPTLQAEAFFNSDAPGASASIVLAYYTDINGWPSGYGIDSYSLTLDSNPLTWEPISFVSTRPSGATWVHFQVAFLDSSISPDYAGYVDDASLNPVPEPSSIVALLGGLGSLVAFRRRKA